MSIKKAAIVTLTVPNYGNRLQNLATQWIFEEQGFQVETIHNPFEPQYSDVKHKMANIMKSIVGNRGQKLNVKRECAFNSFDKKYIKYSKYWINKKRDRKILDKYYDYFICGSDQLWNPSTYNYGANNFAMFTISKKKLTMAPSFGVEEFPKEREKEFREYLNSFEMLSVREETGKAIIKKLTGRDAEVVIDPTLMISSDKWLEIVEKPDWIEDKNYILCYFLGNQYMMDWVNELAKKDDYKVINLMDNSNKKIFCTNPAQFLYLIKNCKLMVTDSFHGSVFSILFQRPLVVMERKDSFVSMNTRLDNLLKMFKITNRKFSNITSNMIYKTDYKEAFTILQQKRLEGEKFIRKMLDKKE